MVSQKGCLIENQTLLIQLQKFVSENSEQLKLNEEQIERMKIIKIKIGEKEIKEKENERLEMSDFPNENTLLTFEIEVPQKGKIMFIDFNVLYYFQGSFKGGMADGHGLVVSVDEDRVVWEGIFDSGVYFKGKGLSKWCEIREVEKKNQLAKTVRKNSRKQSIKVTKQKKIIWVFEGKFFFSIIFFFF